MTSVTDAGERNGKDAVLADHSANPAVAALTQKLPNAIQQAKFDRNELTLTLARENIVQGCRTVQYAGFNFLADVTCVDWYPNQPRFQIVYHLLSLSLKQRIRLCVLAGEGDPSVDSITSVWPAANFFEREIFDLFGVRFGGHPNLRRILMPDDFQGNPLRKDFPVEGYR
ncbi:MAG: NADH-quinone oxidoreductase subunit C [Acidobacteriaceae bacterium]